MARNFNSTSDHLRITSPSAAPGATGTFAIRIRPTWNGNDSINHIFVFDCSDTSGSSRLQFQKFSDNNVYIGWIAPADNDRIATSGTSLFSSGVWGSHLFTWSDSANTEHYYVDSSTAVASRTAALATHTVNAETTFGNDVSGSGQDNANSDLADYALWDEILSASEIDAYCKGVSPRMIRPQALQRVVDFRSDGAEIDHISGDSYTEGGSVTVVESPISFLGGAIFPQVTPAIASGFQPAWAANATTTISGGIAA